MPASSAAGSARSFSAVVRSVSVPPRGPRGPDLAPNGCHPSGAREPAQERTFPRDRPQRVGDDPSRPSPSSGRVGEAGGARITGARTRANRDAWRRASRAPRCACLLWWLEGGATALVKRWRPAQDAAPLRVPGRGGAGEGPGTARHGLRPPGPAGAARRACGRARRARGPPVPVPRRGGRVAGDDDALPHTRRAGVWAAAGRHRWGARQRQVDDRARGRAAFERGGNGGVRAADGWLSSVQEPAGRDAGPRTGARAAGRPLDVRRAPLRGAPAGPSPPRLAAGALVRPWSGRPGGGGH